MKTEMMEVLSAAFVAIVSFAAIGSDSETRLLAFSIAGSALGGIVAISTKAAPSAAIPPGKSVSSSQKGFRWLTNFCGGIFTGPILADYTIHHWLPESNPSYVALASGGLCGFAAVAILCIGGPLVIKWISIKLTPSSKYP
jgi:hypothetical protein